MAVLKGSRAYWLPAPPEVAASLLEELPEPPEEYAVPGVADAIAVRAAVPNKSVLVLYPVEPELARPLAERRLEVAVSSLAWVEEAARELRRMSVQRRLGIHLFVDTGHARTGASPSQAPAILAAALRNEDVFEVRGLMSHLCCSLRRHESATASMGRLGLRLDGRWTEDQLRREAARLHARQVERVRDVFARLSRYLDSHRRRPLRPTHRMLRHVATSNSVLGGEAELFYDMVRVAGALFEGLPGESGIKDHERAPPDQVLPSLTCSAGPYLQAVKTLPGRPAAEWCLSYGCLLAPPGAPLPFLVRRPMRVAVLGGRCHERWLPYRRVLVPTALGSRAVDALGDPYGTVVPLPRDANLSGSRYLRPLPWDVESDP